MAAKAKHAQADTHDSAALAEAQADKAAKAEADKAEAEAQALAKAKAEAEAAEKAQAEDLAKVQAVQALTPEVLARAGDLDEAQSSTSSAEVALGLTLMQVERHLPCGDWTSISGYGMATIPDQAGPNWSSSPAYRSLQAARVVTAVGATKVRQTRTTVLVPIHRVLGLDDGPAQAQAVFAEAVRLMLDGTKATARTWTKVRTQDVTQALENLGLVNAKKGPAKGSEAASGNGKAKADKAEAESLQDLFDAINGLRPEGVDPIDSDTPIVVDAMKATSKVLGDHVAQYGDDSQCPAVALITAVVDLCDRWTVPAMKAAIRLMTEDKATA